MIEEVEITDVREELARARQHVFALQSMYEEKHEQVTNLNALVEALTKELKLMKGWR
jgi:uncharacterized protein involved in exopolysaccharide biosynthesis